MWNKCLRVGEGLKIKFNMTSSILKTAISYIATAILASVLTVLLINSSISQSNHCELRKARLRRDAEKIQEEVKKNDTSKEMEKVILKKAVKIGAVCLDGSPPGYHFRKGFGNGTKKWVIFFNGGAWCFDEQACYQRSHGTYGSSRFNRTFSERGLYSNDPQTNPDFYNWNMVFIIYCDGASFTGMREKPVYFKDKPVYFRGKVILEAVLQDLLSRGVRSASDVLLSGSSAGSLTVLIHADFIKSKMNPKTKVRAIADSGYFVDIESQYGTNKTRDMFNRMLFTHNSTSSLHQACIKRTAKVEQWKCLFPQYFFDLIKTPVFVLQSAYDVWQIVNNLDIVCTIPSYEDLLLFRYLERLRTSRKTRENAVMTSSTSPKSRETRPTSRKKSYASRVINHGNIPRVPRVNNHLPHVQRVNNRGHVQSLDLNNQYTAFKRKFENAHALISQKRPVWRSPMWRNTLGMEGSWNNQPISYSHPTDPTQTFNAPVNAIRQQNPGNTQTFPFYANVAQFKQKREAGKAQSVQSKSHNNIKKKKTSYIWHWQALYSRPTSCTKDETEKILNMRKLTIEAMKPVLIKPDTGLFLSPCFEHSQATYNTIWQETKIKGKTPRDAIAEWYFEKPGNHIHIGPEFEFGSCTT